MVTIVLDIADNGVVKVLEDDNINGAGESFISKTIYDFGDDGDFKNRIKFLKELCLDIGLQTGNDIDKKRLNMSHVISYFAIQNGLILIFLDKVS